MATQEEKLRFIEELDLNPVINEIKRILKISDLKFSSKIKYNRNDDPYLTLISNNIADKCGVMSCLFDEVVIEEFSSGVTEDRQTGVLGYYMSIHWQWHTKDSSMNGANLLDARYKDNSWEFSNYLSKYIYTIS